MGEFKEKLDAELIIEHNMGHFSVEVPGNDPSKGRELPIVVEKIKEMINS